MAVDPGVRDEYLTMLRKEREQLRSEWAKLLSRLELARLEDRAQQALSPEQQVILRDAGLLDSDDVTMIQAEAQKLRERHDALTALVNSVRGLV